MRYQSLDSIPKTPTSRNPKVLKQTMLQKGEIQNLANFSKVVFKPKQEDPEHSHKEITEIIFILEGRGIITIDNKEYKLKPNIFIIINPYEKHKLSNNNNQDLILLALAITTTQ